jgi:hypothetical protein
VVGRLGRNFSTESAAAVALFVLFARPGVALGQARTLTSPLSETLPNQASRYGFDVILVPVTDIDRMNATWSNFPIEQLPTSSVTVRHKPIVGFILYRGCRPAPSGDCDVTADFESFDPTGKLYAERRNFPVSMSGPPWPDGRLARGSGLGLRVEDPDLLGDYRFVVRVTDHVAGVSLKVEQTVSIESDSPATRPASVPETSGAKVARSATP